MSQKPLYQLSGRQILTIALASALIAAGSITLLNNYGMLWPGSDSTAVTFAEERPEGISEAGTVSDEQNSIEVYKTMSPGVAFITTTSYQRNFWGEIEEGGGSGSGSVIDVQGRILTNYHVVEGAQKLTVSLGGDKTYPAKFIGGDPDTDLAVIQITPPAQGLTVVPFGDSDRLVVGQKVLAIGNPFGLDRTLTTGVISGLQRPIRARNGRPIDAAIQTDASINPGNSGGPLLDKNGRMIGINSQILSPAGGSVGVGFAVPVNTAKRIIPQLIANGEVRRPKLAANLRSVEQLIQQGNRLPVQKGLLVVNVMEGGTAARAGIKGLAEDAAGDVVIGDIITAIDGQNMSSLDDLFRYLDKKQIGDTVQVEVYRGGKTVTLPTKLLASPPVQNNRTRRL